MGCLWRFIALIALGILAIQCLLVFVGLHYFTGDSRRMAEVALATEEKDLKRALAEDGPAWVKVRLEPASGSPALECAGRACLWKTVSGEELETQDIKKNGQWTKVQVWKRLREEPQNVPFKLVSRDTEVVIDNWLGIEVRQDLLQMRADETARESSSFHVPEKPEGKMRRNVRESFLLAGTEAWVFGKFVQGKPQVYLKDTFYLTGLGKERFAKDLDFSQPGWKQAEYVFGLLGLLFGFFFFRTLLKKSA